MYSVAYMLRRLTAVRLERWRRWRAGVLVEQFEVDVETEIRTFYEGPVFDPLGIRPGLEPQLGIPGSGLHPDAAPIPPEAVLGQVLTLQVDPARSHFGDALQVVDTPDEVAVDPRFPPFGWSGESLVGGFAITAAELRGKVRLYFGDEVRDGCVDFKLHHVGRLLGDDSVLSTPDGYRLPAEGNVVVDARPLSHGRLELATGRVYDFHYNVTFFNSAVRRLLDTNPRLEAPPFLFPGVPGAGHAIARLRQTEDGGLDLDVHAEMFLPLGLDAEGEPIRLPASDAGELHRTPFLGRNTSLHPYIALAASTGTRSVEEDAGPHREANLEWLSPYQDRVVTLRCVPSLSSYGDDFDLNHPALMGGARGRTPVMGEIQIQFGRINGRYMPYVLSFRTGDAVFEGKLAKLLKLLPPGTRGGLIGMRGFLDFPAVRYLQSNLSLNTDPQKLSIGVLNLDEPDCGHDLVLRKFIFLDLMEKLIAAEPRTPTDSFAFLARGSLSRGPEGSLVYSAAGRVHIPYPDGYRFPLPTGRAITIGPSSQLTPFATVVGVEAGAIRPRAAVPLQLTSAEVLRGAAKVVSLRCEPGEDGGATWEIELDGRTHRGRSEGPVQGVDGFGDLRSLVVAEVAIERPRRQQARIYVSEGPQGTEVLCFSSRETLDFWMRASPQRR